MIAQIAQTSVFDGLPFGGYWLALVIKAAIALGVFLVVPLMVGYMEHKVLAHMQSRLGPMEAGGFHGWAQLVADGVKFVQKEDIVPTAADGGVFSLAPAVVMIPYIVTIVAIPFGARIYLLDLDVGVFFVLAMSSIGVIGVLMAGWASANKFSLIGALRAAAQLIAYELPLVLASAAVVMQAGTMSLLGIAEAQHNVWYVFYPWQLFGFVIFMIAAVAELTRPPFDMPLADSEIIFGAYTEYSGAEVRLLPAGRIRRHRGDVGDRRDAVPRGVPALVRHRRVHPRAPVGVREDLRAVVRDHLAAGDVPAPA